MLGPVMSLPKAISPEHEVDQAQPHGLKEAGVSWSSPCSGVAEETEDSLDLSWEEMMHVTWIHPLQTQIFSILAQLSPWPLVILPHVRSPAYTDCALMNQNTGDHFATFAMTLVFVWPDL